MHTIDCDANPFTPEGWTIHEHNKSGNFQWDAAKLELWLFGGPKGQSVLDIELRANYLRKHAVNANVLDYLLANQHLIPDAWKDKEVYFCGTVYRGAGNGEYVRFLRWRDGAWIGDFIRRGVSLPTANPRICVRGVS